MNEATDAAGATPRSIGWPRAIASGVGIVLLAFLGVAYLPNKLLGSLSGMGSEARSLIVAGVAIAVVVVLAVALRKLQARNLI